MLWPLIGVAGDYDNEGRGEYVVISGIIQKVTSGHNWIISVEAMSRELHCKTSTPEVIY